MTASVVALWILFMSAGTGHLSPTNSAEFFSEDSCEGAKLEWLSKRHDGSGAYAFCTRK